jgi:hypothetical protein
MTPSTALRPREDSAARWPSFVGHDLFVIIVIAIIAVVVTVLITRPPDRVSITIVNDSDYELTIWAAAPDDRSRTPVGIVGPRSTRDATRTIDQGSTWVFSFAGQGTDAGDHQVTREQLADDGWHLRVPSSISERLERTGVDPPP